VARREALRLLGEAGMLVSSDPDAKTTWSRLDADPTFAAGKRLYERRAWALSELTESAFRRHVERGEVITLSRATESGAWAVGVLCGELLPSEDASLRLALLCGDGTGAAALLDDIRRATEMPVRFRAAVDAPMITGHEALFAAAGYVSRSDWEMHILAREMHPTRPLPQLNSTRVILWDPPQRITPPRL
jgi:hypothetical protein